MKEANRHSHVTRGRAYPIGQSTYPIGKITTDYFRHNTRPLSQHSHIAMVDSVVRSLCGIASDRIARDLDLLKPSCRYFLPEVGLSLCLKSVTLCLCVPPSSAAIHPVHRSPSISNPLRVVVPTCGP